MTTLLDIPFEVLPIQTVAQLGTLNKACEERAYKEFLTRDVGLEVYKYLKTLQHFQRAYKISLELTHHMSWAIIRSICQYHSTLVPCNHPMRIETCAVRYDINMTWMMHNHSSMSIGHMVPTIVSGRDALMFTMPQLIQTFSEKINNFVWKEIVLYHVNEFVEVEWNTDPIQFYLVHHEINAIYILSPITFRWNNGNQTQPSSMVSRLAEDDHVKQVVATLVDADIV